MPIIGRHPDCDIVLSDIEISSRHCKIFQSAAGWIIEDLGSSNGTFVNGNRIKSPLKVYPYDTIILGTNTKFPWEKLEGFETTNTNSSNSRTKVLGRHPECDIVITDPDVSGRHCMVTETATGWILEDLGSTNGVYVNGTKVVGSCNITPEDRITLGQTCRFPWDQFQQPAKSKPPEFGTRLELSKDGPISTPSFVMEKLPVKGDSITIGRHSSCEQVIPEPMVSAKHAKIRWVTNGAILEDLNSSNGTFVNGIRIQEPTLIKTGDIIGLGSYTFTLGGKKLQAENRKSGFSLEAKNICVQVKEKKLIQDVSIKLLPGEFAALMGPSGAGKTTLLNALNGYTPPAKGEVLVNGYDLYDYFDQFRNIIGYVPQDDVIHKELTVFEALWYSARLRLPSDYEDDEIRNRIKDVIKQLGLEGTENVLIGSPEKKGISGGQRKRVNLAMELLTDPKILFLDEPTSGLSSEDTLQVMKLLRKLADSGRTILLTIHQPSLEAYRLLDHLVLMAKDANRPEPGKLAYFGPAYPDAVEFFNPGGVPNLKPGAEPSPDEILRGLAKKPAFEWVQAFRESIHFETYVRCRADKEHKSKESNKIPQHVPDDPFRQWLVFVSRSVAIKKRDIVNSVILLCQAPVIGLLVAMVLGEKSSEKPTQENWLEATGAAATSIFMMAMSALWFGASNAVREIVGEWAVYRRERMVNLGLFAYVASKFTILGALCSMQCIALIGIITFFCGMKAGFISHIGIVFLTSIIGVGIGLVLSSLAKTTEVAIAALPIVLLALFILGGMIQPVHRMNGFMQLASNLDPARWAFEGLMVIENKNRDTMQVPDKSRNKNDRPQIANQPVIPNMKTVDFAEGYFPKDKSRNKPAVVSVILLTQLGILTFLILVILRWRDII